jgi:hypothetical protein
MPMVPLPAAAAEPAALATEDTAVEDAGGQTRSYHSGSRRFQETAARDLFHNKISFFFVQVRFGFLL